MGRLLIPFTRFSLVLVSILPAANFGLSPPSMWGAEAETADETEQALVDPTETPSMLDDPLQIPMLPEEPAKPDSPKDPSPDAETPKEEPDDERPFLYDISLDPRIIGGDVELEFPLFGPPERKLRLHTRFGAGIEKKGFHRTPTGELFFAPDTEAAKPAYYRRFETGGRIGLMQGLGWNHELQESFWDLFFLLESSLEYRIKDDEHEQLIFACDYPHRRQNVTNRLLVGVRRNAVSRTERERSGGYHEITFEYGPWWLGNELLGKADYRRLHARTVQYVPMITEGLYLVNGTYFDGLWGGNRSGTHIPLTQRGTFGGLLPMDALGGAVRGFDDRRFDADYKLANLLEVRYLFPPMKAVPVTLGLTAYWDTGYFRRLRGAPADTEYDRGWLNSNGFGLSFTLDDCCSLVLYTHYAWFGPVIIENQRFTRLSLSFGFHQ